MNCSDWAALAGYRPLWLFCDQGCVITDLHAFPEQFRNCLAAATLWTFVAIRPSWHQRCFQGVQQPTIRL